jgi:hypothetical protein
MGPEPQNGPSSSAKRLVRFGIAPDISLDLFAPPVSIRFGPRTMIWTPVPKTPINKDRNLVFDERNIGATPKAR